MLDRPVPFSYTSRFHLVVGTIKDRATELDGSVGLYWSVPLRRSSANLWIRDQASRFTCRKYLPFNEDLSTDLKASFIIIINQIRGKVTAIEELKDLTSLSLDELIKNLKVHEMIIKKDSKIVKAKGERKSLALKAKKKSSDEECSTFGSSWSDSGEENDENVKDKTCLVAQASNEVCFDSSYFSDENSSIDDLALDNEYDK
nr:UBN2 domain-containing protein [Tanacetum cinerariifolium]